MKNRKALLIIDMQKGSFTPETPRFDANGVVKRINALAEIFRSAGFPVIFIQHNGAKANRFVPYSTEWELLDELKTKPADIKIEKYANDVFYKSKLLPVLVEQKIEELFIMGCATDFCVESTIQSGLSRDYNITVVEDGHTTGDRPHLKAEKVIEHYNWIWKNMIPTNGKVEVRNSEQIRCDIETY